MNKSEIEARLERSLRNQVRAPKLDGRFEAAVWAQIEGEAARTALPALRTIPRASRWLFICNVVGIAVAIALVFIYGLPAVSGSEVDVAVSGMTSGFVERTVSVVKWPITIAAVVFGLSFTPLAQRVRAEFT